MLNILICHYGIVDKGGFSRNFNLAKGLVKLGHKVVILTASNKLKLFKFPYKKLIRNDVVILIFPDFIPKFLLEGGFGFISIILKIFYSIFNKFDLVQCDTAQRPASGLPCLINKFLYKSKFISEWWDYYGKGGHYDRKSFIKKITIGFFDNYFEIRSRNFADGIVCITNGMRERAIKLGYDENKLCVLNGGADVDSINFIEMSNYKEKLGISADKITFGLINIEDSEIEDFKAFLSILTMEKYKNKIACLSFGTKLSEKSKKELKLNNDFLELGWIDFKKESIKLSAVDFFVILKEDNLINRTGWPNKTGDCFAAGRQILTNGTGDLKEYIKKYPDLFIYCDNSISSLVEKVDHLIKNYNYYVSKRNVCRRIAETELSWNSRAKELESFYYKIIQ